LPKRILVVDDEVHIRYLLTVALEELGYQVLTAGDGFKAVEIYEQRPVDLVILDWILPGMKGIEVLKRIREIPTIKQIPVLMISAYTDPVEVAMHQPDTDFLQKPFDIRELREKVDHLLKGICQTRSSA